MSLPPPPAAAVGAAGLLNPLEAAINSVNTNTYLIGMSMILLNLGGRHLAPSLTPEQDKFFQNPWIRRAMLFVVIFVATRNVFTALWLSIGLVVFIGYLLNEHSSLYLFGEPIPLPKAAPPPPPTQGLSPEEQEIYRRLHEKIERGKPAEEKKEEESKDSKLIRWYKENMNAVQQVIN